MIKKKNSFHYNLYLYQICGTLSKLGLQKLQTHLNFKLIRYWKKVKMLQTLIDLKFLLRNKKKELLDSDFGNI